MLEHHSRGGERRATPWPPAPRPLLRIQLSASESGLEATSFMAFELFATLPSARLVAAWGTAWALGRERTGFLESTTSSPEHRWSLCIPSSLELASYADAASWHVILADAKPGRRLELAHSTVPDASAGSPCRSGETLTTASPERSVPFCAFTIVKGGGEGSLT